MGERKVLNKYFPPDFDPSKLAKIPRKREEQWKVRMMLPMSVRCITCGTYMYKGTKFNTRLETLENENYLGFKIYRFYFKCSNCGSEFTLKTDPENTDYTVESGAKRNYEPWKAEEQAKEDVIKQREEDTKGDTMKELEYKTKDSKMEMDIMQALDHQKLLNSKTQKVKFEDLLGMIYAEEENKHEEEDADELTEAEQARLRELKESGAFQFRSVIDAQQIQNEAKQKLQLSKDNQKNKKQVTNLNFKVKPKRQIDELQVQQQINQNGQLPQKLQKIDNGIQISTDKSIPKSAQAQTNNFQSSNQQSNSNSNSSSNSGKFNGLGLALDYESD